MPLCPVCESKLKRKLIDRGKGAHYCWCCDIHGEQIRYKQRKRKPKPASFEFIIEEEENENAIS